ncbi:hypothetical protein A2154_03820 [Candidatus Gottesmanbacteria bacterium RBG_16_43_7]|uniref:Glycosyltransferase RgtA/B/C/D-like domain-containing protein n=1 Tax=Candidatus Gottesmanbacteria bacterium RBG_16_43_7 TaxID=1798373 RepID=A0A1F5Z947_9BACT|nr:MAG: hypothetical protein A2154_03820 [Candidatus Gottesmanbacteria bacterium RBG_16_43_7]
MLTSYQIRKYLPLILLIAVSISVRVFYTRTFPLVASNIDSREYYAIAELFQKNKDLGALFTPYRAPLYPFITYIFMILIGRPGYAGDFGGFGVLMSAIAFFQSALAVIAALLLFKLLFRITKSLSTSFIVVLFYTLDMILIPYERIHLTENVALNLTVIMASALWYVIAHPSVKSFTILLLIGIMQIMLRPAFLALVPLILIGIPLLSPRKKTLVLSVISLAIIFGITQLWTHHNRIRHGLNRFSVYSTINILGRIVKDDIPTVGKTKTSASLTEYRAIDGSKNPYDFLNWLDPLFFQKPEIFIDIDTFNLQTLVTQFPKYTKSALSDLPLAFSSIDTGAITTDKNSRAWIFGYMQNFYRLLHILFVSTLLPFMFLAFWIFNRDPTQSIKFGVFLGFLGYIQVILVTGFLGYEDFSRLAVPYFPLIYIGFGTALDNIRKYAGGHK